MGEEENMADLKIQDWTEEGFIITDFFSLGLDAVKELNKALSQAMGAG